MTTRRRAASSALPCLPFRPLPVPSPSFPSSSFPFPSGPLWAPWRPVFSDAALVVPMRLALMPWLMLTDPAAGHREAGLMVDEKRAAYGESLASLWLAPLRYWTGIATLAVAPGSAGFDRALAETSRLAAKPYGRRVRSNRRRLARGG